jgi:hypothetical protein
MERVVHGEPARSPWPDESIDRSSPDETWLFAPALRGIPEKSALLALGCPAAQQELLEWVRAISTEAEARWDPAKHPRGAFPQNRGWFSTTPGASGLPKATTSLDPAAFSSDASAASRLRAQAVSDKGQAKSIVRKSPGSVSAVGASPSGAPATVPTTKIQLPADGRGTWIKGGKGHGTFRFNNSIENKKAGVAGQEFRFEDQHIAVGGFPEKAYYGGSAQKASVSIETVTGFRADNAAADAQMRIKVSDPTWKRPKGYLWNHTGPPGSKVLELVDEEVHGALAHTGSAALPRAEARIARAQGATGRAIAVITVYLVARDALRAGNVLGPELEVERQETYRYKADDGSTFVVWPSTFWKNAKIQFIDGPRRGEEHEISDGDVEVYKTLAEKTWGKYIPGVFGRARFIPGTERSTLPIYS